MSKQADKIMGASTYIQNSPASTNAIDIETTSFGCSGVVNGVWTCCYYLNGLPVGSWSGPWDTESGVHIQTDLDQDPTGVWDMNSGYYVCTVNTNDNTITYNQVSAPADMDMTKAIAPKVPEVKHKPLKGNCNCKH
jgi:hypothetical protein